MANEDRGKEDLAELTEQMRILRADVAKFARIAARAAEAQAGAVTDEIGAGIDEASRSIGASGRSAQKSLEHAMFSNPLATIGVALGLGFLVGALSRR
jgi:ElaB/YqjD/DUF883 family membrane-anchored ribosome-binding protein